MGHDEVPVGRDEVLMGRDEVPAGQDEVLVGADKVPMGEGEIRNYSDPLCYVENLLIIGGYKDDFNRLRDSLICA
jgi:hypothetical protein